MFGGSFDPIHHGHLVAAASLAELLMLDEVRLVVAAHQPLKQSGHAASADARADMVELAVRGHPVLRVDRSETRREGPSYTVDTLRSMRAECPEASFVLLLGADAAEEFPRWREADAVRALAEVVVFGRGTRPGEVAVPRMDLSSTDIRTRVGQGQSIRFWVPDAVAEYIAAHRLYQHTQDR